MILIVSLSLCVNELINLFIPETVPLLISIFLSIINNSPQKLKMYFLHHLPS